MNTAHKEGHAADGNDSITEQDIVARYNEQNKRNRDRFIYSPARRVKKWINMAIEWLNDHNGLLTALATGVLAYLTISISRDSGRQAETAVSLLSATKSQQTIMQGQLDEMRKQREFTIAQLRASLKRERPVYQHINALGFAVPQGEDFVGWSFNPVWTNVGETSAKNVSSWSFFTAKETPKGATWPVILQCPDHPTIPPNNNLGEIIEKGGNRMEVALNVPKNLVDRATGANPSLLLYFGGRTQYNDIFQDTPLHYFEWCVLAIPSNATTGDFSFHIIYEREG
jgi:hypothetical protein